MIHDVTGEKSPSFGRQMLTTWICDSSMLGDAVKNIIPNGGERWSFTMVMYVKKLTPTKTNPGQATLQHHPHHSHVVFGMSPVAFRIQVASRL